MAMDTAVITINNTWALTLRVATQLLIPPALFITLGCIICDSVALGRVAPELEDEDVMFQGQVLSLMLAPPGLLSAGASILGMTGLLMQSVYLMTTLAMLRNGVSM